MSREREGNLLGALALAVTDAIQSSIQSATDRGASVAAAMITLATFDGLSIEELRHHLGLSHPATVRLVDRLADEGLLQRHAGGHGRTLALHLTAAGRQAVAEIETSRGRTLEDTLATLTRAERQMLTPLLEKLLVQLTGTRSDAHRMCRLCDQNCCDVKPRGCPVDQAAAR